MRGLCNRAAAKVALPQHIPMLLRQPAQRGGHQMAVHDLLAGAADGLLREAASYDLGAPLPSAPALLSRYTHGDCDWFTGICSVPDRVTWLATGTDRTASRRRRRRAGAMGEDVNARRPRSPRRFGRCRSMGRRRLGRGRAEGAEELVAEGGHRL